MLAIPNHRVLLDGDLGVLYRDFGTIFLAPMQQQVDALRAGQLLLWDSWQFGGTPFWPLPNTAPAYLPLLALLLSFGTLAGLNLAILLHVLFGAAGSYALVHRMSGSRAAGLIGGVVFLHARYTQFLADVLPLEGFALAWLPWAFLFLVVALERDRWLAPAVAAGVCFAAIPWSGGYIVLLRGFLLAGVFVGLASLRPPLVARVGRGVGILSATTATCALLGAARFLPTWRWIPLTDRSAGTSIELAMEGVLTVGQLGEWLLLEGIAPLALLAAGVVLSLRRRFDWTLPVAAMWLVLMLLSLGPLHQLLMEHVPGFGHIREPRRAFVLLPVVLAAGAGLGAAKLLRLLATRSTATRAVAALSLIGWLAVDRVSVFPVNRDPRKSLSERLEKNAIHQDLARRAAEEPERFRVHDYADTRPKMKRTADLIRSCLRLESLEGAIGNIQISAYDTEYLGLSRKRRAVLWGAMNVRYVTSQKELDDDGLVFLEEFPRDHGLLHPGSDGPFLYRNERELPRAYLIDHAVAYVGGESGMWTWMLLREEWDPGRVALLRIAPGRIDIDERLASWFDALIAFPERDGELGVQAAAAAAGTDAILGGDALVSSARGKLGRRMQETPTTLRRVADPAPEWNRCRVDLPEDAGGRILVLAETYSLYPGWRAYIDGDEVPIYQASGAASALLLPRGARQVDLRYRPPGLGLGLLLSSLGAAAVVLVVGLDRRRRNRPDREPR